MQLEPPTFITSFLLLFLEEHPEVVSVFLSKARQLHTTHSWEFMMMEKHGVLHRSSIWPQFNYGEDVIVSHIDSGVWPESKSFSDENYGPIPSRWKGNCKGSNITCNRKLIGAKYFAKGALGGGENIMEMTAREEGHGTHTLSTVGGNLVASNLAGLPTGTAKGGSPWSRVATYKSCWNGFFYDPDILAAIDQAIHDGVDIISISVGWGNVDYFTDPIVIGSYHAVKKGIVVSSSTGNSGPVAAMVTNVAPWIITVTASTTDLDFANAVELGDGQQMLAKSLAVGMPRGQFYPIVRKSRRCGVGKFDDGEAEQVLRNWVVG